MSWKVHTCKDTKNCVRVILTVILVNVHGAFVLLCSSAHFINLIVLICLLYVFIFDHGPKHILLKPSELGSLWEERSNLSVYVSCISHSFDHRSWRLYICEFSWVNSVIVPALMYSLTSLLFFPNSLLLHQAFWHIFDTLDMTLMYYLLLLWCISFYLLTEYFCGTEVVICV